MDLEKVVTRQKMLDLLESTHRETHVLISGRDPDQIIHNDERHWRVRDILGHLGVWDMEAARSLQAYAEGGEYCCMPSEAAYYDYNGPAADKRKAWSMEQVWAEYDEAHEQLRQIVRSLPDEKWDGELLYPWNERGSVEYLIRVMMKHETADHLELIVRAIP
jgi:hypothetical protein